MSGEASIVALAVQEVNQRGGSDRVPEATIPFAVRRSRVQDERVSWPVGTNDSTSRRQ
jgi:hypothetical protein